MSALYRNMSLPELLQELDCRVENEDPAARALIQRLQLMAVRNSETLANLFEDPTTYSDLQWENDELRDQIEDLEQTIIDYKDEEVKLHKKINDLEFKLKVHTT